MAGVTGILLANTEDLGMPQILTTWKVSFGAALTVCYWDDFHPQNRMWVNVPCRHGSLLPFLIGS
jgi:hypothetical protein